MPAITLRYILALCASLIALSIGAGAGAAPPAITVDVNVDSKVKPALIGNPPIEKFTPNIEVDSQNFCITQDARGVIFICNGGGLIEFDGERWKLHKMVNRDLVRSLATDANDNLYVGGYNLFGVLRRDAAGGATLEDYSWRFKAQLAGREFADVWDIEIAPEGIYFKSLQDLFFIDPKTNAAKHWYYEGKFGFVRHHQGRTIAQFRGEGFKVRVADNWQLIAGTDVVKQPLFHALPLADNALLLFGKDANWWRLSGDVLTIAAMPQGTPQPSTILGATVLADGSLALASSEGKVFSIDNQLKKTRAFRVEAGAISGVSKERGGGFLAVADLAIYRVAWPAQWSILGIEQGGGGPLLRLAKWNNKGYVLSEAGSFEVIENVDGQLSFAAVPWGKNPTYALLPLSPTRALLSTAHKLMVVENNVTTEIASDLLYPRSFWPSRFHPNRVYLGTELGLRILDISGSTVGISAAIPNPIPVHFNSIAELSKNEIWLGTERHGIWRVRLADDGKVDTVNELKAGKESLGLKYGQYPSAEIKLLADGTLLASTGAGIFIWDGKQFVANPFNGLVAMRAGDETLRFAQAPDGILWAYSNLRLWKQEANKNWVQQEIQNIRKGSINDVTFDAAGSTILVNSHGLMMHHPAAVGQLKKPAQLLLRAVTQTLSDGKTVALSLNPTQVPQFEIAESGLRFEFALPDYSKEGSRRYQGRLVGDEPALSEWASASAYSYSALPAGEYSMQLRAKEAEGNITEIPAYPFEILPPWYRRAWALALWLALTTAAIMALVIEIVRRRTLALERRNQNLESKVAARTSELEIANARLEALAHIDGLTGIPNRRHFDVYLAQAWAITQQKSQPIALLIVDVDHFKQYNDHHGHQKGDELLCQIAACLNECLASYTSTMQASAAGAAIGFLARYGGEEFVAVLPNATLATAKKLAETMRSAIAEHLTHATVSVGVSHVQTETTNTVVTAEQLFSEADNALYAAKAAGRNCVRG